MHDFNQRQAAAARYYETHDRFAPGEEAAIAEAKLRRAAADAEATLANDPNAHLLDTESFVDVGLALIAAASGFEAGYPARQGDDTQVLAVSLSWTAEAHRRLDTDVFVQHEELRSIYDGILTGLDQIDTDPGAYIVQVFAQAHNGQPSVESTGLGLGVVLAAGAFGIALTTLPIAFPGIVESYQRTANAWRKRCNQYGFSFPEHREVSEYLAAANEAAELGILFSND